VRPRPKNGSFRREGRASEGNIADQTPQGDLALRPREGRAETKEEPSKSLNSRENHSQRGYRNQDREKTLNKVKDIVTGRCVAERNKKKSELYVETK